MSVILDTSQVEMWPYVSTASSTSEVHKLTAVWSSDLVFGEKMLVTNMPSMFVTLDTCGGSGAEVARAACASVDRSKRAKGRRRSTRARRIRPRGGATSHFFSGWLKSEAPPNMTNMVVTLETCGGGDVGAEVARVARASVDRSKRTEGHRRSILARRIRRADARRPSCSTAG